MSGTGIDDIVFKNKMAGVTFTVTVDANLKATVSGIDDVSFKKTLTGAEFTLYDRTTNQPVLDSEGNPVKFAIGAPGTVTTVTLADGSVLTVTVRSDGSVLVEGMPEGSYYLKETKAPGGFFLSDETQNFNVTPGEITSVDVDDKKLQVLPGTGGPGVLIFILAGAGMMAGAYIWLKKSRKDTQLSW